MSTGGAAFELHALGGPWARRLAPRRAWVDELPWAETAAWSDGRDLDPARRVWVQTAWSEYAAAASFAEIASALLACAAPIDLVAAAGDFVVDEIVHAEAAARVVGALGGAPPLTVALDRLVRPPERREPLVAAAELVVRACCVGEALTVPMLKLSRKAAGDPLLSGLLGHIVADEAGHAQLGWWFLDWAAPRLDDDTRDHLGRSAGGAVRAFAPLLAGDCQGGALGVVACAVYDPAFVAALARHVVAPLAARGIIIPAADLAAVGLHGAAAA